MARHEKRFYGLDLDWARETLVTSGATEALICAVLALVDTGDEVVLFQPFYDAYPPMVQRAGGVPRVVTLRPPHWTFTREDLARAFGPRTKAVILNNPLNPAGKVYSAAELALIAEFVEASDAYVIADEVYEHLVYDGLTHIPFNTLPGMFERTVKISSAGKMFSLTGWKIGLVTAQADLLVPVLKAHQFLTFTTPPNLQAAVALGLDKEDGYFDGLAARMQAGRDHLVAGFRGMGIATHDCAGTYFVNIDIGSTGFNGDDVAFCRHLTEAAKVAAIPVSAFCSETPITDTARFAFCKSTATRMPPWTACGRISADSADQRPARGQQDQQGHQPAQRGPPEGGGRAAAELRHGQRLPARHPPTQHQRQGQTRQRHQHIGDQVILRVQQRQAGHRHPLQHAIAQRRGKPGDEDRAAE